MPLRLKSRQQSPPNGFRYTQKETGWKSWEQVPATQWDFNFLCREVKNHRLANAKLKLSLDMNQIESEVDLANAQRVLAIPGAESYVIDGGAPPPKTVGPSLAQVRAAAGAVPKILLDWLGEGCVPVDQALAEKRAEVCSACRLNSKSELTSIFTDPAAAIIKKTIALKNGMKISTSMDSKLGTCQACLCAMKLKVHVPIQIIKNRTEKSVIEDLKNGDNCWIISEIK